MDMDTRIPLHTEQLVHLERLMEEMTQGDYEFGSTRPKTKLGAVVWLAWSVLQQWSGRLHVVTVTTPEEQFILALTGSSRSAGKNARALANLLAAWPYLLAELKRGRAPERND